MIRVCRRLGGFAAALILSGSLLAQDAIDSFTTFDDLPVGKVIDRLESAGVSIPGGGLIASGLPTSSGKNFLRRNAPIPKPGSDPDPLVLLFDQPQSFVRLVVGNPDGAKMQVVTVRGFTKADPQKPVLEQSVTIFDGPSIFTPISLCRILERDLVRVEVLYDGGAVEAIDTLEMNRYPTAGRVIDFEDRPLGTTIAAQYPGVAFEGAPEIVSRDALGVGVRSGSQALRRRVSGEYDPDPLVFRLDPPQGAVRVHVGYPKGENDGQELRVVFRAYGGTPTVPVLAGEREILLSPLTDIVVPLEIYRREFDLHRVEVLFDRAIAGYETIDDLEIGPTPAPTITDGQPPVVLVSAPVDGAVIPQRSSSPADAHATILLAGAITEDVALSSVTLEVKSGDGSIPYVDMGFMARLTGAASPFGFAEPVQLSPGRNVIRISARDAAGNLGMREVRVEYAGPGAVQSVGATPSVVHPQRVFRELSATGPSITSPDPVVSVRALNLHAETRVYLASSGAIFPPSAPDLIDVDVLERDADGNGVRVRVPASVFEHPGRYNWLVWDLWSRPGAVPWTRVAELEVRRWSEPALWSMGFVNADESNGINEFEAVFGEDLDPGFLETTSDLGGCSRGTSAVQYFLSTFNPGMNAPPGSCYGFAALTQLFAQGTWDATRFDAAVHQPSAFFDHGPMLWGGTGCDFHTPASLWATIQSFYGVQNSYQDLVDWSDQVHWDGRWVGDPMARANAMRGAERNYTIAMIPDGMSAGHVVAPYRVQDIDANTVRVWVIDSNFPYDIRQPEEALVNVFARNRFIDIDRASNRYRFCTGATNDPTTGYQDMRRVFTGQGMSLTRTEVFLNPRTIPGLDLGWHQTFGVTGDAQPLVTVENKGSWGWDPAGTFIGTLGGISPKPMFGFAGDALQNALILVPTNHGAVRVTAQAHGPEYRFRGAAGGVTLALHRQDAVPGDSDQIDATSENGVSRAFRFRPSSATRRSSPSVTVAGKGFENAFEWIGLSIPANEVVAVAAQPDGRGASLRNDTSRDLSFGVVVRAGAAGQLPARHRLYGPFVIAPGVTHQLLLTEKAGSTLMTSLVDLDGDGKPDDTRDLDGLPLAVPAKSEGDCNGNGLLDLYEVLNGTVPDGNGDLIPDGCAQQGGGGGVACPPDGTQTVRIDAMPDGTAPSKIDGITTLNRPAVVNRGVLSPMPDAGATTDPAGMAFRFSCPRGFVRLDLRAGGTGKAGGVLPMATVRAYTAADATKPILTVTRRLEGDPSTNNWFEVLSPIDQDIAAVEVTYSGNAIEWVGGLEHGTYVGAVATRIDFDDLAPTTQVEFQYRGLRVVSPSEIVTTTLLEVPVTSGNQALRRRTDTVYDPRPMTMRFIPPQQGVRMRVGFPPSEDGRAPLRVILRGYGLKGNLLGATTNRFSAPAAIRTPIGLVVPGEDRIASVEVEYASEPSGLTYLHAGFEAIDHLEFGPYPPRVADDRTPPLVEISSPSSGLFIQDDPAATNRTVGLVGTIREAGGIASLRAEVVDTATGTTHGVPDFDTTLSGAAPNYSFARTITFPFGEQRVFVYATDYSGNETRAEVLLTTEPFPPVTVRFVPGATAVDTDIRDALGWEWTPSNTYHLGDLELGVGGDNRLELYDGVRIRDLVDPAIQGQNFHRLLSVYLAPTNAITGSDVSAWNRALFQPVSYRLGGGTNLHVTMPASVKFQRGTDWRWVLYDAAIRPGASEWIEAGGLHVYPEETRLNSFPFKNTDDTVGLGMFDSTFGNTVYIENPICDFRDPVALVTFLVFKIWMDNTEGSCVGFAATSQLMRDGFVDPAGFIPGVHYPAGLYPRERVMSSGFPLPEVHNNPTCGPRTPANVWAFIRGMQGVQTSTEFIAAWHAGSRIDGVFSIGGDPNHVLELMREHSDAYVLCMVPRIGAGHGVAPYQVIDVDERFSRIRVYDPNHPAYIALSTLQDDTHQAFQRAASRMQYIEIDRVQNTYRFRLGSRGGWDDTGAGTEWSGNGLYAIPLDIWRRPRHWMLSLSGITQLAFLPFMFGTAGDARPHITAGTNEWGWGTDGKFVEKFPGIAVPPLIGGPNTTHSNAFVMLPNLHDGLAIDMNSAGGEYHFATVTSGAVWDLRVRGSHPGDSDRIVPTRGAGGLHGFDFTPMRDTAGFIPTVGFESNGTNRMVLRWAGLELPAGGRLGIETDPVRAESRLANHTHRVLHPRLIVEAANPGTGNHVFRLPVVEIADGAVVGIRSEGGAESGRYEIAMDADGDGRAETVVPVVAERLAAPGSRGVDDANADGIADAVDIALGTSADANANGIPDEIEGLLTAPVIGVAGYDPTAPGVIRLAVRAGLGATVVVERSENLRDWLTVGEGKPGVGAFEIEQRTTGSHAFYRARLK